MISPALRATPAPANFKAPNVGRVARYCAQWLSSAAVASAYGMHFQRKQFFLTDARTHSGSSGSPVFRRRGKPGSTDDSARSWQLLGIHSTRMDMRTRDHGVDESLGLNCAWYATVLTALTREAEQRH
mgnify:CR=1 FL=1